MGNSLQYIGGNAIDKCPIKELVIPNTVTKFGTQALCCDSLKYLVVPDKRVETEKEDEYGHAISYLCNLEAVSGHNEVLPQWVRPYICEYSPFAKRGMTLPFTYYAKAKIGAIVEKWQQRGEFETTAQWKARVTEEKRNAIVSAEMPKIRAEYISLDRLPSDASETIRLVRIGDYDVCPCIGKHVRSTSQIGRFEMLGTNWDEHEHSFRVRFKIV